MANNYHLATTLIFFLAISNLQTLISELVTQQPLTLKYHHGDLLRGPLTVNLVWYGQFTPSQRSIIVDFIQSLNQKPVSPAAAPPPLPSVAAWWKTTEKYHNASSSTVVGKQILDEKYSLGKTLKNYHIRYLATKGSSFATKGSSFATKGSRLATNDSSFATEGSRLATKDSRLATKGSSPNSINVVLTAKDVSVDGFCRSRCATHGSSSSSSFVTGSARGAARAAYAWVGNSETQCPGQCAWPFHQPIYGPQSAPLVAPNGDVGVDGMVINLATVLAGAVTNPFNEGYYQGPAAAPLEAVSACTGIFGSGAYPGYTGRVLVDKSTGGSYNAHGLNGRKYLVPAMWDPKRGVCSTLV